MIDIGVSGLVKSFDLEKKILDGLTFQIDSGEQVGLLGRNGAGKTTLFKILTGELDYDSGEVFIAPGKRLGLISQIPVYPAEYTVEDVLRTAFSRMQGMKKEMDALAEKMAAGDSSAATLKRYGDLSARFEGLGGWDTDTAVNKVANGLTIDASMRGRLFAELSGGENLTLKYYSSIFDSTELKCEEINSLYNEYLERLNNSFQRELKMRYTVLGVHRDDMNLYIDNNDVKEFGSQGQQRSTALALKLAEAEIIRQKDETPIMILDDVLSELDAGRQRFVLNHIINSQVFITCCNINDVKELKNGKVWKVENGIFTEE